MNQPDGGPAFPTHPDSPASPAGYLGMSLRDWFAGMVLQGLLSNQVEHSDVWLRLAKEESQTVEQLVVQMAFDHADAMIAYREKT